jgi:multiple sugar transport system permease protein
MPLISKVGKRSWQVRLIYTLMFIVLAIGAASMIYPLLIMATGSIQSDSDSAIVSPYPRFWFDDVVLFRKFAESKYNGTGGTTATWGMPVHTWEGVQAPPPLTPERRELLDHYLEWRKEYPIWDLGFVRNGKMLPVNARLFRNLLHEKYHGDVLAMSKEMDLPYKSWHHILPPQPNPTRTTRPDSPYYAIFEEFSKTRPVDERILPNLDARFWKNYLVPNYTNRIAEYNKKHGTSHKSYNEVFLTTKAPPPEQKLQRADWEEFVRNDDSLKLVFIRISPRVQGGYQRHLKNVYDEIGAYNKKFGTTYASFDDIPIPTSAPTSRMEQVEWDNFIKDRALCPLDALSIDGPRESFESFVAAKRGLSLEPAKVGPLRLPMQDADWHDTITNSGAHRWEFTTRNYRDVMGYIALHGNGIMNTIIFCGLAIITHLVVNPLAAYALSRYKMPSTYSILLFCMATMAFPGEVTMIPKFLLLKSFPLWGLLAGTAGFVVVLLLITKLLPDMAELLRILISLAVGVAIGTWLLPQVVGNTHVSLLNTFAALILPGMANGFSIFLLKGFFDSLPAELYEAAELDGANEWTKFWMIAMSLSKPILAVIGLGAFTGAYSQFMMALIIVPDPKMWPLMVWLYQLQVIGSQSVIYAGLMIAAIPTLLVFIFCQNLIIRGIVVPVEK